MDPSFKSKLKDDTPIDKKDFIVQIRRFKQMGLSKEGIESTIERWRQNMGMSVADAEQIKDDIFDNTNNTISLENESANKVDTFLKTVNNKSTSNKRGPLSTSEKKKVDNHNKVINRINEIIKKANDTTMDGRTKQYIQGGNKSKVKNNRYPRTHNRNYNHIDPQSGLTHIEQSPNGNALENQMYKYKKNDLMNLNYDGMGCGCSGGGPYGLNLEYEGRDGTYGAGVVGGSRRKTRSDKGKPRKANDWHLLVKKVAVEYNLPYNKALKKASELKKDGYSHNDF